MKTKEELNALKEEVETLNKKLHELTEEELEQVSGGLDWQDIVLVGHKAFELKRRGRITTEQERFIVLSSYDLNETQYCQFVYSFGKQIGLSEDDMQFLAAFRK